MNNDIETWENEGGSTGKRRAKSILELNFADLEARVLAHTLHHGGFIRGNVPYYVGETVTGRFTRPGLRENEIPAILTKPVYPKPIRTTDITINIEGAFDPKNWPPEVQARMRENVRRIAETIDRNAMSQMLYGSGRIEPNAFEQYCRDDVEATRKLNDMLFPIKRPFWRRVWNWIRGRGFA